MSCCCMFYEGLYAAYMSMIMNTKYILWNKSYSRKEGNEDVDLYATIEINVKNQDSWMICDWVPATSLVAV